MADEADLAQAQLERELERAIAAARGIERTQALPREICPDCGAKLEAHRLKYGYCVPCVEIREARMRWR